LEKTGSNFGKQFLHPQNYALLYTYALLNFNFRLLKLCQVVFSVVSNFFQRAETDINFWMDSMLLDSLCTALIFQDRARVLILATMTTTVNKSGLRSEFLDNSFCFLFPFKFEKQSGDHF